MLALIVILCEALLPLTVGMAHLVTILIVGTTTIAHTRIHRVTSSLLAIVHTHLECRFQKHSQQVNEILGSTHVGKLSLALLTAFPLLSTLVEDLLIANGTHFFWIAVLYIESILTLEKDIPCELLGQLALVLFLEVDESLLGVRNDLDSRDFTLAC